MGDTMYFGGTVWNPDSLRWEAVPGSTWTFDSGVGSHFDHSHPDVDPSKDPSRHAFMEGWFGKDFTRVDPNVIPTFSRRSTSDFSGTACVGTPAGLGGTYSMWAGFTEAKAAGLGWIGGQGYGNDWNIALEHDFTYSGSGTVAISFGYTHDLEPGFDFATLMAEYPGGIEETLHSFTQSGSGTFNLAWTPLQPGAVKLKINVASDGSYSDEDGLYDTSCGAFAFDDISVNGGGIAYSSDFESDDGGWVSVTPSSLGDWTDIRSLADIDSLNAACPGMSDSVLVFFNDSTTIHEIGKMNYAISPWIDLGSVGAEYYPIRFIEFDHADEELNNQYIDLMVQTYDQNAQGTGERSDWVRFSSVNFPNCAHRMADFSGKLPLGAGRIRIAIGVIHVLLGPSTPATEILPWIDNVRVGVARTVLGGLKREQPGDAFPTDGTLGLSSPARCDAQKKSNGFRGDTLVVRSAPGPVDLEVEAVFSVLPGPGISTANLNAWLSLHPVVGTFQSKTWYSARLDTAEVAGAVVPDTWMTTYHESDPNFRATDTALDPGDPGGRLLNDIFPDDLFTPGTRLCLYYRARTPQTGNVWVAWPDPSGGGFLEMDVLPSSMTAGGNHNSTLFISDVENVDSKRVVEEALARVLPGTSSNAEGTPWDQLDVNLPSGFGLDASAVQLQAYDTIIFNSPFASPTEPGAHALHSWIQSGPTVRNLYMSGGKLARAMALFPTSWNGLLLNGPMGVDFPGIIGGISTCYELLPVSDAPVGNHPPRAATQRTRGGDTRPAGFFEVDRIVPYSGTGAVGAPLVDEHFFMGLVDDPSSIVNQDALFRTVFDAVSLHARYEEPDCNLVDRGGAIDQRLREVFTYFGLSALGLPDGDLNPRSSQLGSSHPNPFSASTVVSFSLLKREAVTLRIFDLRGRLVRSLVDRVAEAGNHTVRWDARNEQGATVPAGVYFYKLTTPNDEQSRRVVVIR